MSDAACVRRVASEICRPPAVSEPAILVS